ncbi:MAG: ATPase family associated with various cellular activities (AAA) [Pelotomaculum sp. PtaB.Bin104]|nr:MAG: ATPase family associated with various cellular activities (AAA) [Pelotomaculum sp. PtaB.Bin104]
MLTQASQIISEVKKAIVGKDQIIEKVLMVVLAGGHILLEDVPGVGKTTLALAFSKSMGLDCRRIQFTPDTMASDIVGYSVYNKQSGKFEYLPGAVFCNMLLADEINRTSPKTQAALLEVLEEGCATVDGVTRPLPDPFICIATQNPTGSIGTQNLPNSQLDRFMVRLSMGYPDLENQIDIIKSRHTENPLNNIKPALSKENFLILRSKIQEVFVADDVIRYAVTLCERTRNMPLIEQGVSPRAVLALAQMAKACAFLSDRDFVIPEDIKVVFKDVCCHRLVLKPQAKIMKETAVSMLDIVLAEVPAPSIL